MDYKFYLNWCRAIGLDPVRPQSASKFKEILSTERKITIRGNYIQSYGMILRTI